MRRRKTAKAAPPNASKAAVEGSGTASPVSEKAPLNVGAGLPPTISVPTRSQSGSRFALRIHAWRSVAPAGKGDGLSGRAREPEKLASGGGDLHLRHEEIMIRRQTERRQEIDRECDRLAGYRPLPSGRLPRRGVDSIQNAVQCGDRGRHHARRIRQLARR